MAGAAPAIVIIPARLGSTRLPRKALLAETGKPLIQHVCESALRTGLRVVVATDAEEIVKAVGAFGGEAVMTSASHPNGTSRIDEAAQKLGLADDQPIVNVQGDEPEIGADVVHAALAAMAAADIGTVATAFAPGEDPANPNLVKVVRRADGTALYFSRALIPHGAGGPAAPLRHVGIYAYRRGFLRRYAAMPPSPLEQAERLEQLRALEHGFTIGVEVCAAPHQGIDTPEQYAAFVTRWRATKR